MMTKRFYFSQKLWLPPKWSKSDTDLNVYIHLFSSFDESKFINLATKILTGIETTKFKPNLFLSFLLSDPARFKNIDILSFLESENRYVWNLAFILLSDFRPHDAAQHLNFLSSFLLMRLPRKICLNLLKAVEAAAHDLLGESPICGSRRKRYSVCTHRSSLLHSRCSNQPRFL